ncbi:peroxiredoxin-like family protein [Neptunicella marina]|uniref:thioredoxin-dependent peroxiredoxin n=1 Tax=Neptunicella marina TaxID=2125989 RepID=A0A8J6IUI1_9ALTE|nr:peroxiredoxin-like family protein [Neptunicella marina]MBC3766474.1 AhpC/TSA family protein [Neptunicella marina]
MKKLLVSLLLILPSFFTLAFDRSEIANKSAEVTPLLNGQTLPDITVKNLQNDTLQLKQLISKKPTIMVFYRGGWCPYCNAQLAGLKEIESKLTDLGYQILAISPDSPERLKAQQTKQQFNLTLLSDSSLDAIRKMGIAFLLDEKTSEYYRDKVGVEFMDIEGTSRVALPVPAVYIVDQQGLVQFNYVNPNFRVRLPAQLLYDAAKVLAVH